MTEEGFKRKLTTILSADVVGYSRLMEDNEEATIQTLNAYRNSMSTLVQQHRGRVVDMTGDNLMAEFSSVVDAVKCAVETQKEMSERNADLPDNRRMLFRIGINLGDIVEEDDRIYGDGVNIAARLEGLAEGGSICISGTAYDQLKNKLELGYQYLGEHSVKNIAAPVRAYKILMEPEAAGKVIGEKRKEKRRMTIAAVIVLLIGLGGLAGWYLYIEQTKRVEPASVEEMAFPLPEKPSIAVLPFDNMSGDPEQDYIADGFTENIITGLSQIPEMFVISRNSVFTYKGKPVKVKQVSEEFGVKYVLEGSIQKAGDRLRVTAQLIDALEGHHLWAERYDRELNDLFKLQDEITIKILSTLHVKLVLGGDDIIWWKTDSFEAWSHNVKGWNYFDKYTKQDNLKAREHHEQALKLDPDYWAAWELLAWTYIADVWLGSSESPKESIKRALEIAKKTSERWGKGDLHMFMSQIYYLQRQYEKAIVEGEKAVALAPNSSRFHIALAASLNHGARPEDAIVHAKTAMRLEPYYPARFLYSPLGAAYDQAGQYEEALEVHKKLLERALKGEYPIGKAHRRLAGIYARLDRIEEARAHGAESLKIDPNFSVEKWRRKASSFFKNQKWIDSLAEMLLKAGFPEHPPLKLPDKPSIAVLPFDNLSDDPQQEYFSDGLTDQIISALSKVPHLFVIARNSTFTYKGKPVKVQQVAKELGVRYVLEGSVQKSENRVRITAQLVDAVNGHHMWSESYDRDLKDIFALQDEITMTVLTTLRVKLTLGEQTRMYGKGTKNLKAYLKVLEAVEPFFLFKKEANARAKQLLEEAISLDPEYGSAYSFLGFCHFWDAVFGWSEWPKSIKRALELAQKALSLDDSLAQPHELISKVYVFQREYEKAIDEAQQTIELNPNGAWAVYNMGWVLRCAGRSKEGIPWMKKSIRLNPIYLSQFTVFDSLGRAYFLAGRYEEAIAEYKKAVKLNPDYRDAHVGLAATYAMIGREKEARTEVSEILRIEPNFSIKKYARFMWFQVGLEPEIEGLRTAGLPE
jgi:adenylate cyclase